MYIIYLEYELKKSINVHMFYIRNIGILNVKYFVYSFPKMVHTIWEIQGNIYKYCSLMPGNGHLQGVLGIISAVGKWYWKISVSEL